MPNYETSTGRKYPSKVMRYLVTYEEDIPGGVILTFGVDAGSSSEATSKVIDYIDNKNLHHNKDHGYMLIPRVSKQKADYNIPYKSNQDI